MANNIFGAAIPKNTSFANTPVAKVASTPAPAKILNVKASGSSRSSSTSKPNDTPTSQSTTVAPPSSLLTAAYSNNLPRGVQNVLGAGGLVLDKVLGNPIGRPTNMTFQDRATDFLVSPGFLTLAPAAVAAAPFFLPAAANAAATTVGTGTVLSAVTKLGTPLGLLGVGAVIGGALGAFGGSKNDQNQSLSQNPNQTITPEIKPEQLTDVDPTQKANGTIVDSPGASISFDQRQWTRTFSPQYTYTTINPTQGTSAEQQQTAPATANWLPWAIAGVAAVLLWKK